MLGQLGGHVRGCFRLRESSKCGFPDVYQKCEHAMFQMKQRKASACVAFAVGATLEKRNPRHTKKEDPHLCVLQHTGGNHR